VALFAIPVFLHVGISCADAVHLGGWEEVGPFHGTKMS
jgi:hypothetical protein